MAERIVLTPPKDSDLEALEIRKASDGSERYFIKSKIGNPALGIVKSVMVSEAQFEKLWDVKPEDAQKVKAIWHAEDKDLPVTAIGVAGEKDGETFYKINESNTSIPGSQIEWSQEETEDGRIKKAAAAVVGVVQSVKDMTGIGDGEEDDSTKPDESASRAEEPQQDETTKFMNLLNELFDRREQAFLDSMTAKLEQMVDERTQELTQRVNEVADRNTELENQVEQLKKEKQELQDRLDALEADAQEIPGGFKIGDQVGLKRDDDLYIPGYEVTGTSKQDDKDKVDVKNTDLGHTFALDPANVKKIDELNDSQIVKDDTPPPPGDQDKSKSIKNRSREFGDRIKSAWNRSTGWIGYHALGRSAHANIMRKTVEKEDGKEVQVRNTELVEEEVDGYSESERKDGRRVLGATAIGGAIGLVAGYLIWHKTGHNIYHEVTNTEPPQPNTNAQHTIETLRVKNQSLSQQVHELSHVKSQPFNPDRAHRLTASGLTGHLHNEGQPGNWHLYDGNKLIYKKKLDWNTYGLFDKNIRDHLRSLHYKVSYGQYGINRFKSIVWKP